MTPPFPLFNLYAFGRSRTTLLTMTLVGRANPSFWTVLQALQRDQSLAAVTILRNQRGQPPVKRAKRSMTELQKRLALLCKERRDDTRLPPSC